MTLRMKLCAGAAVLALSACGAQDEDGSTLQEDVAAAVEDVSSAVEDVAADVSEAAADAVDQAGDLAGDAAEAVSDQVDAAVDAAEALVSPVDEARLQTVLAHPRRDEDRARDGARNPGDVVSFFGLTPDMTVVEVLPSGGWYTRVLAPYVAEDGRYGAVNYAMNTFEALFSNNIPDAMRERITAFPSAFPATVQEMTADDNGEGGVEVLGAFFFGALPAEMENQADAMLFVRALHNLARLGDLEAAIADAAFLVKPGGVVGVVQHAAQDDAPDEYVDGSKGYLRQSAVIEAFEAGGFEFVAESDVNANPADTTDYPGGVWTLPPGLRSGEDEERYRAIGESNRMTLLFRLPDAEDA